MDKKEVKIDIEKAEQITKDIKEGLDPEKLKNLASGIGEQFSNVGEVGTKMASGLKDTGEVVANTAGQAITITGNVLSKGGDMLDAAEQKLEEIEDKLSSIESDIESKFEHVEEELRHHSKHIRFLIAIFFFPIWFTFYNMIHTTLATWDIFVAVYRKIDKTRMKIIYTLTMCCVGCGIMQMLLFIVSIFHINCEKFKSEQSLQIAFKELAYEEKCHTAMKMEQSLMVFFGHYKPIDENDMIELQNVSHINPNKSRTFTEKKGDLFKPLITKELQKKHKK